jgi:hypothetical protein
MKTRNVLTIFFICVNFFMSQAQIKIHNDNHISIGSLTKSYGVQVQPNGYTYFQCTKPENYAWMNLTYANNPLSACYIVQLGLTQPFFVYGNGVIHSTSQFIDSDMSPEKNNLAVDSALSMVLKLQSVYYDLSDLKILDTNKTLINGLYKKTLPNPSAEGGTNNEFIDPKVSNTLKSEKDRKYIGLVAEAVERVVPELVRSKPDGSKAIAYYGLTSLLVEAVKEQQAEIEQLQKQLSIVKDQSVDTGWSNFKSTTTVAEKAANKPIGILFQNTPNPFSEKTTIRFKLYDLEKKASIFVFDLQGSLIKSFENLNIEDGEITLQGYELKPGMYSYTLVVDGNEADTKRIIVTN